MHAFNLPLFGTPAGGKTQPLPITHVLNQQCAQTSVRVGVSRRAYARVTLTRSSTMLKWTGDGRAELGRYADFTPTDSGEEPSLGRLFVLISPESTWFEQRFEPA